MSKRFANERGFTLVELLTAMLLLGVVVTISSMLLIKVMSSDQNVGREVSLREKTNVLISDLRGQFYKSDESELICLDDVESDIMFNFEETKITNENGKINDTCFHNVDLDKPVELSFTTADTDGKETTVKTTFKRKDETNAGKPRDFTIPDMGEKEWTKVDVLPCVLPDDLLDKNIEWTSGEIEEGCEDDIIIPKSLKSTEQVEEGNFIIDVGEYFYATEHLDIFEGGKIMVGKDAQFKGAIDMRGNEGQNNASIEVEGMIEMDEQFESESITRFTTGDAIFFRGSIDISDDSSMHIDGSAYFGASVTVKGPEAFLHIIGSANFNEAVELLGNADLKVSRDAKFSKKVDMKNGTNLEVGRKTNFEEPGAVSIKPHSTFCGKGLITPNSIAKKSVCP